MKKPLLKIISETLPILFGILLSYLLWQNNFILLVSYLALSVALILYHDDKSEFLVLAYGILIGFTVEVLGTQSSRYQSFTNPDFLGIPMWLPIAWGYGFVAMKRIGFILRYWK